MLLFLALFNAGWLLAQNELKNVWSSYSSMHDGMYSGGVSTSQSYIFVAQDDIIMPFLRHNGDTLFLLKGDSITYSCSTYRPYEGDNLWVIEQEPPAYPQVHNVFKVSEHAYTLGLHENADWTSALQYLWNGELLNAAIKPEYDSYQEHYAP